MVFCTGCDGCGYVELERELCALWKLLFDSILLVSLSSPYNKVVLCLTDTSLYIYICLVAIPVQL